MLWEDTCLHDEMTWGGWLGVWHSVRLLPGLLAHKHCDTPTVKLITQMAAKSLGKRGASAAWRRGETPTRGLLSLEYKLFRRVASSWELDFHILNLRYCTSACAVPRRSFRYNLCVAKPVGHLSFLFRSTPHSWPLHPWNTSFLVFRDITPPRFSLYLALLLLFRHLCWLFFSPASNIDVD